MMLSSNKKIHKLPGMDAMKRMLQEVLAQWKCEESVKIMRKRRKLLDVL
jgi:hypothetical protein